MKAIISIAALVGIAMAGFVFGQNQSPPPSDIVAPAATAPSADPFGQTTSPYLPFANGPTERAYIPPPAAPDPNSTEMVEIRRVMDELRHTEDATKKTNLTKQLESAVTKCFDADLKSRETELSKIEERVKKLRTQLDRRRAARSDIIQLQLKVLANDAEGLGFSTGTDFQNNPLGDFQPAVYSLGPAVYPVNPAAPSPPDVPADAAGATPPR